MTGTTMAGDAAAGRGENPHRTPKRRIALHAFLIFTCVVWLFPIAYAIYTSFRPYAETNRLTYVSIGGTYNLDNYVNAWDRAQLPMYFMNTVIIVVPAVILVLFLASMAAFVMSRYSWRANVLMLMLFTALNLLPPQIIITPLFKMYLALPMFAPLSDNGTFYNQYFAIALIHISFQLGFCTFVMSNYMKTLPRELNEAAIVDGASVWTTYRRVILPLTKPALAALATLEVTFIYNDFFWALILMKPGPRLPITTAINNLQGQFFTDQNLVAAGAVVIALPTIIVYILLQKQFIGGLSLGSTKG
jgi:multiple sugar transport system permease protein